MPWKPHVTVAAILEREGRFLFVEERVRGRVVINQPAGHLDEGESLLEAVRRETLEETAWRMEPTSLVGFYQYRGRETGETFLRACFAGQLLDRDENRRLDDGILRTLWLEPGELDGLRERLRSPMVTRCVADYLDGHRHPLELIRHVRPGEGAPQVAP